MFAQGVPEVAPTRVGIHLSWSGPLSWVYAPEGWTVQRRLAGRLEARDCERLDAARSPSCGSCARKCCASASSRLRSGGWLSCADRPRPRRRLDDERRLPLRPRRAAPAGTGRCHGEAVVRLRAVGGQGRRGQRADDRHDDPRAAGSPDRRGRRRDPRRVDAGGLRRRPEGRHTEWNAVPPIVKGLTLPFRELMPSLTTRPTSWPRRAAGCCPARRSAPRSSPGSRVSCGRPCRSPTRRGRRSSPCSFARSRTPTRRRSGRSTRSGCCSPIRRGGARSASRCSTTTRAWCRARPTSTGSARPSRTRTSATRTTGSPPCLPARSSRPTSRSTACACDCRGLRTVGLTPGTPENGQARVTRHGIPLDPERESFWLTPALDDWSLVVDFPAPADAVVLELADGSRPRLRRRRGRRPVPAHRAGPRRIRAAPVLR